MSNPILEQLYDGEIHPAEQIVPSSPEYKELAHKIELEKEYFWSILSKADNERFDEFCEMYAAIQIIFGYEDFAAGYKLGARLTFAAFEDDKKADSNDNEE
jgi:hypothetical protein